MPKSQFIRTGNADLDRVLQSFQQAIDQISTTQTPTRVSVKADYTVKATDDLVFVDASAGPVKITLPPTGSTPVMLRKTDASGNAVTVQTTGGQKINGGTVLPMGVANTYAYDVRSKAWHQL